MSRFQTSWEIAKRSWAVLKSDKTLAWFPVLSALGSLLVVAIIGGLIAVAGIDNKATGDSLQPIGWVLIVVAYLALAIVQTYFLAALVAGADQRLRGNDSTVRTALDIANSRLHRLLPWAVVTATVTMVLQAIEERFGLVGTIVARLVGLAWNLVTFLVVPILVLEDLGVGDALKRSKDLFKKTWGENVIGQGGLGIVGFLAMIPGVLLVAIGAAMGTVGPDRARRGRRGVDHRLRGDRLRAERHLPHRAVPLRGRRPGARRVRRPRPARRVPAPPPRPRHRRRRRQWWARRLLRRPLQQLSQAPPAA